MTDDRNTKILARRVDPRYVGGHAPLRALRRTIVVLATLAVIFAWGGWHLWAGSQRIYNPGPVAAAHAMFETDCARCHEGSGNQFFKTVNDSACLRCHDAAIHAEKQAANRGDPHAFVTLVKDQATGKDVALRSANCVACHVEHKGHAALRGVSDKLCTQCHENVSQQVAGGKSELPNRVTAFAPNDHPAFGRHLTAAASKGGALDPTQLEFNHQLHAGKGLTDCTRCHATGEAAHAPQPPKRGQLPPYEVEGKHAAGISVAEGARRYMEPIAFARHCAACHEIDLSGGAAAGVTPAFAGLDSIEHGTMQSLRGDIARMVLALPTTGYKQIPPKEKSASADPDIAPGWDMAGVCIPKISKPAVAAEPKDITREQWLEENTKYVLALAQKVAADRLDGQTVKTDGAKRALAQVKAIAAAVKPAGTEASFAAAVEVYAVYAGAQACAKCHTITSPLAPAAATNATAAVDQMNETYESYTAHASHADAQLTPAACAIPRRTEAAPEPPPVTPAPPVPAGDPADKRPVITSEVVALKVVPTGMPAHPRRWFTGSVFDHQSHRALDCAQCHGDLKQSVATADLHMPTMASCLPCHQSGPSASPAVASSACITCHVYHDRDKEREPVKQMTIPELHGTSASR